jgi:hypothetical protein
VKFIELIGYNCSSSELFTREIEKERERIQTGHFVSLQVTANGFSTSRSFFLELSENIEERQIFPPP